MKKAGFIVGAKYGRGFSRAAGMAAPAGKSGGHLYGRRECRVQIGASETDVILLIMNDGGMKAPVIG